MEEVAVGEVTVGETGTLDASAAELDAGGGVRGCGEEEVERVRAAVAAETVAEATGACGGGGGDGRRENPAAWRRFSPPMASGVAV